MGFFSTRLTLALILLSTLQPAQGEELSAFVPPIEGAKACWELVHNADLPAVENGETVTRMKVSLNYRREMYPDGDTARQLLFYSLGVEFRDGRKGQALGSCLPGADDTISCGVECDGGGVDLSHGKQGTRLRLGANRKDQIETVRWE